MQASLPVLPIPRIFFYFASCVFFFVIIPLPGRVPQLYFPGFLLLLIFLSAQFIRVLPLRVFLTSHLVLFIDGADLI